MVCRYNQVILEAENVLTPAVLAAMYNLSARLRGVHRGNQTWQDVCFRVPVIAAPRCLDPARLKDMLGRRRRAAPAEHKSHAPAPPPHNSSEAEFGPGWFEDDWETEESGSHI